MYFTRTYLKTIAISEMKVFAVLLVWDLQTSINVKRISIFGVKEILHSTLELYNVF